MMKNYLIACLVLLSLSQYSCKSKEEKMKDAEEEGNALVSIKSSFVKGIGDALKGEGKGAAESVSEGTGEVVKGLTTGFDKSLNQANVQASDTFLQQFELGRSEKMYSDTTAKKLVTVYLVAKASFEGKVKLLAFDASNKEIGRSTLAIKMEEDDASYHDFRFDPRTPLLQADHFKIDVK